MVNVMCDIMVGIFEHMDITAKTDVDKRVNYKGKIMAVPALKKYHEILLVGKETENSYAGDQWTLREAKVFSMEDFWNWDKVT